MMKQKSNTAGRARASAIPTAIRRDTAVEPTQALGAANATVTKGLNTVINSTQDFVAAGKANLEAVNASGKIWAAGVQDLTRQMAATLQASYEESVVAFKALSAAKSLKEVIELQSNYSKAALAKAVAESKKVSETSVRLTEQVLAPLQARVAVAVGSFAKAA
jgi:phasin family protein